MSRLLLPLLVLATVATIASPASAQNLSLNPPARPDHAYRITPRWDTYVFSAGNSSFGGESRATVWANVVSAQLDFDVLVARLAIPLGFFTNSSRFGGMSATTDQAELGNLTLEALGDIDLGADHRLLVGGGIGLPTATDQLDPSGLGSGGLNGYIVRQYSWRASFRNAAAWQEHTFSVWPTVEYRLAVPWVLFTTAVAVPLFIPTSSRYGGALNRGNVELMVTLDVTGAVRILDIVDVGASFLAWALPSGAGYTYPGSSDHPDLGQAALTLFVRTDDALDAPIGGGFEMIFNLDDNWGPTGASDRLRFWGAHIFLTARIDGGESRLAEGEEEEAVSPY